MTLLGGIYFVPVFTHRFPVNTSVWARLVAARELTGDGSVNPVDPNQEAHILRRLGLFRSLEAWV